MCWQKYPISFSVNFMEKVGACVFSVYQALSPLLKGPGDEAKSLLSVQSFQTSSSFGGTGAGASGASNRPFPITQKNMHMSMTSLSLYTSMANAAE